MKRESKEKRKVRCDKKKDVKPTVPINLFNCVSDLSSILDKPIKDIVEHICIEGIDSKIVIEQLSHHFKRDYDFRTTVFFGNKDLNNLRYIIGREKNKRRISTRFTMEFYERVFALSNALDLTPTSATGRLLEVAMKDISIIDKLIKPYTYSFNEYDKKLLKGVIKYIRKDNPFIRNIGFMDIIEFFLEWLRDN
jgi:hypothetical protein